MQVSNTVSLVAAGLLFSAGLSAQPASLAGTVIDSTTKQPIQGVHITIFSLQSAMDLDSPVDARATAYGAMSRADGRFSITGLPATTYLLQPERTGYVVVPEKTASVWASRSLLLKPGENKTDFVIAMTPRAVIMGRVTDEFGDPVQSAQIRAIPAGSGAATAGFDSLSMFANTDDRGEFRLHGVPGKYLLSVDPSNNRRFSDGVREVRTDSSQHPAYSTTWYPSVQGKEHAVAIDAPAGHDVTGIEIRLIPHRSVSVSGIVTGLSDADLRAIVRLWGVASDTQVFENMHNAAASPDGSFVFTGLTPGDYRVQAFRSGPGRVTQLSAVAELRLESGENGGTQLSLVSGEELNGVLEIPAPSAKRTITLEPVSRVAGAFEQNRPVPVNDDGSFHLKDVFPGKYELKIDPMPENAYVKTVRLDNTDFPDAVLDLTRGVGSSKLRVSLSLNAATISGSIIDDKHDPAQYLMSFVALARSPDGLNESAAQRLTPGGTYSLKGIRPGKYRLYVFNPVLLGDDPELRKKLFEKGEPIEVHEGDHLTKNVKLPDDK